MTPTDNLEAGAGDPVELRSHITEALYGIDIERPEATSELLSTLITLSKHSAAQLAAVTAENARLRERIEQAFKDGVHYATMVKVKNTDEARDDAWKISRARAALSQEAQK